MLVLHAVWSGDALKALRQLEYIADLGGAENYPFILAHTEAVDPTPLIQVARRAFASVETIVIPGNELPWPVGPNHDFFHAVNALNGRGPFLWLEWDVLPTRPSWLADLEREYLASGKPFMGRVHPVYMMKAGTYEKEVDGDHMNGSGIYPANTPAFLPAFQFMLQQPEPFDLFLRWQIAWRSAPEGGFAINPATGQRISQRHSSDQMCLAWCSVNYRWENGRIVHDRRKGYENVQTDELDLDRHVLHHGCKDDSLLTLLRDRIDHIPMGAAQGKGSGWTAAATLQRAKGFEEILPVTGEAYENTVSRVLTGDPGAPRPAPVEKERSVLDGAVPAGIAGLFAAHGMTPLDVALGPGGRATQRGIESLSLVSISSAPDVSFAEALAASIAHGPMPDIRAKWPVDYLGNRTFEPEDPKPNPAWVDAPYEDRVFTPATGPVVSSSPQETEHIYAIAAQTERKPAKGRGSRSKKAKEVDSYPPVPERGAKPAGMSDEEWVKVMPADFKAAVRAAKRTNNPPYHQRTGHFGLSPKQLMLVTKEPQP